MRVACIGDLHGSDRWKEILNTDVDHYVFVGDYVDSEDRSDIAIESNLREVIAFKQSHEDEVTLLLGNHDVQYLLYPKYRCNGFRGSMLRSLKEIFERNRRLFQVSCLLGSFVFTHAGLSRRWVEDALGEAFEPMKVIDTLNKLLEDEHFDPLFMAGECRGGKHPFGGPLWCDYHMELVPDPAPGFDQVVGHTRTNFLLRNEVAGQLIYNVNYVAYSEEDILVLDV